MYFIGVRFLFFQLKVRHFAVSLSNRHSMQRKEMKITIIEHTKYRMDRKLSEDPLLSILLESRIYGLFCMYSDAIRFDSDRTAMYGFNAFSLYQKDTRRA